MFSKSLVIFVAIGILAGLGYGAYLIDFKTTSQLVYVEGPSISIVTEKSDFKLGEQINIRIVNSGTVPVISYDVSYGLRVTGLSGILMYSAPAGEIESTLDPGDEVGFSWDQTKTDGDAALEGLYKISARVFDGQGNAVEKSTTITIWK